MRTHPMWGQLRAVFLVSAFVTVAVAATWAYAEEAPATKGPDIVTAGAGPYAGITPAELAKLADQEAAAAAAPLPAKLPETETVTRGDGNTLTPAELSKLDELLRTLPFGVMMKAEDMRISKEGVPELTAQEREKRQGETAAQDVAPTTEKDAEVSTVGTVETSGPTPEEIAKHQGETAPSAPQSAPGTDR